VRSGRTVNKHGELILDRPTIELMLHRLRERKLRPPSQRIQPANQRLPSPVPTEHREAALEVLLEKQVCTCLVYCKMLIIYCQIESEEYRHSGGCSLNHNRKLDGIAGVLSSLRNGSTPRVHDHIQPISTTTITHPHTVERLLCY
jgi:hypothetical protein